MYDNRRLLDVITRHQIYLEGVKDQFALDFNDVLRNLYEEFKQIFARVQYKQLSDFTKKELFEFVKELNDVQSRIYDEYTAKLLEQLKQFMLVDANLSKRVFATLEMPTGEDEEAVSDFLANSMLEEYYNKKEGENLYPFGWFVNNQDKLWSAINNAPLPANGMLLSPFITGFVASASYSIQNIVNRGYANQWSFEDTFDEIAGTKTNNYRNGQLARLNVQAGAVTATALQHISSTVQAGLASIFFEEYFWSSILDGRTTLICRERNGRVYKYGEGPLPPAHINCRSKAVPKSKKDNDEIDFTYNEWLANQPNEIQNDILGTSKATKFRSGGIKAKDLAVFDVNEPLSIKGFSNKLALILKR